MGDFEDEEESDFDILVQRLQTRLGANSPTQEENDELSDDGENLRALLETKEKDLQLAAEVGEALLAKYRAVAAALEERDEELNTQIEEKEAIEQAFAELQAEHDTIKGECTKWKKRVSNLEGHVESLEDDKHRLAKEVSEQQATLEKIKNSLNRSEQKLSRQADVDLDQSLRMELQIKELETQVNQRIENEKDLSAQILELTKENDFLLDEYEKLKGFERKYKETSSQLADLSKKEKAFNANQMELEKLRTKQTELQQVAGDADDLVAIVKELIDVNNKLQQRQQSDEQLLQQALNEIEVFRKQAEVGSLHEFPTTPKKSLTEEMQSIRTRSPSQVRKSLVEDPRFSPLFKKNHTPADLGDTRRSRALTMPNNNNAAQTPMRFEGPPPSEPAPAAGSHGTTVAATQTDISIDGAQTEQYRKILKMKRLTKSTEEDRRKQPRREAGAEHPRPKERMTPKERGFPFQLFEEYVKIESSHTKLQRIHESPESKPGKKKRSEPADDLREKFALLAQNTPLSILRGGTEEGQGQDTDEGRKRKVVAPPLTTRTLTDPESPTILTAAQPPELLSDGGGSNSTPLTEAEEAQKAFLAKGSKSLRRTNSKGKLRLKTRSKAKLISQGQAQAQGEGVDGEEESGTTKSQVPSASTFSFQYSAKTLEQLDSPPVTPVEGKNETSSEGALSEPSGYQSEEGSGATPELNSAVPHSEGMMVKSRNSSISIRSLDRGVILEFMEAEDGKRLQEQLSEVEKAANHLWVRLNNADTVRLNRSMRRAFDIKDLTKLSNGLIDNIIDDAKKLENEFPNTPLVGLIQNVLVNHAQMRKNLNDFCLSYVMKLDEVAQKDHHNFSQNSNSSPRVAESPRRAPYGDQSCLIS